MIAPEYFNNHVAVEGEIIVKSVPSDAGFVLVWNPTTKKISRRTHTEIVSDLNLVTSDQLGNYWQRYNGSSWNEIRSDKAVVILDELGNQAQNIYTGGLLVSNVYADSSNIPTNGIYSKGNIATLNYGSASDWNAKVSQSQLNDYVTLNTEQNIEGAKWFKTIGGNQYLNHRLRIISEDNSNPGMVFYKSGVNVGTIQYDGSNYLFTTSDTNAFANLVSAGFIKEGSNNGYALLGGGGHKPISDFALINHTHSFLQSTATGEADLNNLINDYTFNYYPVIYPTSTNLFPNAVDNANGLISISTHPDYGIQLGINTYGDIYKRALQNGNFSGWSKIITSTDSDNYVTLHTPQTIIANKTFADSSQVKFLGGENNHVSVVKEGTAPDTIVSGFTYSFYDTIWKVGNKRGGSANSLGYSFEFSGNGGASYQAPSVLIQPDGNILTSNFGSANLWNAKVDQSQLANYQPLGQYVRIGGTGTTGNNILLGWTGSQLQATVDATTIGNLWHSGNLNPSNFLQNDKIASKSIGVVATTLDAELPNGGFISSYYSSSWAGTDRPDGASYGGYIKFSEVGGDNNNLDFYYNNGHNGDSSRLWFRTKEAVNGVKPWMELWHLGNFNPNSYVTIDTPQTIIAHKTFSGAEGNGYTGAGIMINGNGSSNTIYPTLSFHQPTLYAGTISHRGDGFYFMNINGDNFDNVKANGFLKSGSHDGYILLGGGGHKPVSDFATSAQLANYLPLSGGTLTGGGRISEQGVITIQQASTLNATGLFWEKMDDSDFMAGIGALTTGDNFAHVYMGWGLTPWAFANSLAVGENAFRYKDNQVWHAGIFNPDLYLTIRGGLDTALIAKTDFPLSITDYVGDPALTNFQSYYGTSFHFKGGNTWYNRLDFPTTADNLFLYQGINTTDMSLRGYIPIIDINAINWTSLNFSPDSKVNKSGDTMTGALLIGNNNIGKQRVLHLAEPTLSDSYGFNFYTDTSTGLLTLHGLNNGLNNSAPILSANRANNFVGINKENPTTELDVNGNITSNGFIKNNSSDDYFLMGGGGQLTKYSKDDAFVNSYRDFTDGTLITTNIDYSQTQGESFLLEIKGNMYGGGIPMDTKVQGYIYADTIINQSGYSTYADLTTIIAMNINGNLCFWFPRLSYWQGFSVKAITTGGGGQTTVNRVVSIDNSAEPVGTKQVKIAIYTLSTQNWVNNQGFLTSANLNSYVTQSALNAQLGSYATLNGVQTFANTNTFLQSPVIPNGTIGVHAVNLNQLLDVSPPYHWNYVGQPAITNRRVLSEMTWNNYGNGHTIFDISSGTTPWGASKSNVDAEFQWNPSYPTLVGGNGSGTYGVRVDSARNADNLGGIPAGNYATQTWVDSNFISQSHPVNNITQANINSWNTAAGGSSHTHSNLSYLNNIDQYLGTGQAPQFSSVRLMNSIGYGTLALEEDYIGGEAGLVDLSNEVFYAGRINEYIKYGSSVNGFEGLNIHFDAKLLGIGREAGNHEDKVQIAGDLSVDTVDIHNTSMQLILNPLYNTDGDVRRSRNAHIYIVTRETVRLPQKPILGQRIEIFNDSDSYIEVTHDNVGTMFKVPGFCKITGIAANKGFKFDTEPIYTKQYDI
ncbi:hypothetical protein [Chryseobacterium indoltheticum]|uniref:hypothetical protein n=1 Tax=Chryseobacterium indoltheticum TaxID=254 RepID=UPI0028F0EE52|nr:hypothetical protein [Chryseobacterium indoltheticum]